MNTDKYKIEEALAWLAMIAALLACVAGCPVWVMIGCVVIGVWHFARAAWFAVCASAEKELKKLEDNEP